MADFAYACSSVAYTPSNTCSSPDSVVEEAVDSPPMSPARSSVDSALGDTGSPMSVSSLDSTFSSSSSPSSFHANDAEESPSPLGLTSLPDSQAEDDTPITCSLASSSPCYHNHHHHPSSSLLLSPAVLRPSTPFSPSAFSTSSQDSYPEYETWNDNVLSADDSLQCWRSRWSRDKEGNMIALRDWDVHSSTLHSLSPNLMPLHSNSAYSSDCTASHHDPQQQNLPRTARSHQKPYRRPSSTTKDGDSTNSTIITHSSRNSNHHVNNAQWSLWEATRTSSVTQLKALLVNQPSKMQVNMLGADGDTVLHLSCRQGNLEMVQLLICHGANVSLANRDGWTPLHLAAYYGWADIASYLISMSK